MRFLVGAALAAAPAILLLAANKLLGGWALYSEEQVFSANVLHPLFHNEKHFSPEHWRPEMAQRERLEGLTAAYEGTVRGLEKIGLRPFLESSSLIGLLRHDGHMPWEVDGDVGVVASECYAANVSKAALAAALPEDFFVMKFACACEEDCEGDDKRMAGKVAHKPTGVVIDICMYAPVKQAREWQKEPRFTGAEWWERVDDHQDYTFPRDVLLPLQDGVFEGVRMALPNKPREFLSWDYGSCLGTHLWPWRLLLYTPASVLTPVAIILKGAATLAPAGDEGPRSPWLAVASGALAAVALSSFQGGLSLVMLLVAWLCELAAVRLAPELLGRGCGGAGPRAVARQRRHRLATLAALVLILVDLRGCFGQLHCQLDDFYFHPMRPKGWTLCLFGKCWDDL